MLANEIYVKSKKRQDTHIAIPKQINITPILINSLFETFHVRWYGFIF